MTLALIVLALLCLLRDDARPSNRLGRRNRHR
jgi:hypothetical protein